MKILIKIIIVFFIFVIISSGIWLSLDSYTKCKLLYGKNICNFYAMMDIAAQSPSVLDFERMMDLCKEMSNVPKKDGCFEYIAETFISIDVEKAQQACNEIKEFDNIKSREDCYNKIQKPFLKKEFCGWSTYGKCSSDLDCMTGGCSSQVCQSKKEEPIITTCEWRDCYNAKIYGIACKCIENKCQWTK